MTYTVTFGKSTKTFYTRYQVEQFVRALELNGTHYKFAQLEEESEAEQARRER